MYCLLTPATSASRPRTSSGGSGASGVGRARRAVRGRWLVVRPPWRARRAGGGVVAVGSRSSRRSYHRSSSSASCVVLVVANSRSTGRPARSHQYCQGEY